jgi:hypothetical protein
MSSIVSSLESDSSISSLYESIDHFSFPFISISHTENESSDKAITSAFLVLGLDLRIRTQKYACIIWDILSKVHTKKWTRKKRFFEEHRLLLKKWSSQYSSANIFIFFLISSVNSIGL